MQRQVRELLAKNKNIAAPEVKVGATVGEALMRLDFYKTGALMVMESGRVVGILSERDFARASVRAGWNLQLDSKVEQIMATQVACVTEDAKIEECMAVMSKLKVRHLPVLRDGYPIALLSMRHLVEAMVEDKDFQIAELTKYVTGSNFVDQKTG